MFSAACSAHICNSCSRYLLAIKKYVACSCATLDIQRILQFPPPFLFGTGAVFVLLEVLVRP